MPEQRDLISTVERSSFVALVGLAAPYFQHPSKLLNLGNLRISATSSSNSLGSVR